MFFAGFIIGLFISLMLLGCEYYSKKIKVDYSIEAKKNYRESMAGEFAIYTKRHFWSKWVQRQTFADLYVAKKNAESMKEDVLPNYY